MPETIDTSNDCLVAMRGETVIIMIPLREMDKLTALRLAAYLVALADEGDLFEKILAAVCNT